MNPNDLPRYVTCWRWVNAVRVDEGGNSPEVEALARKLGATPSDWLAYSNSRWLVVPDRLFKGLFTPEGYGK